jgi:hypothetical protein
MKLVAEYLEQAVQFDRMVSAWPVLVRRGWDLTPLP